MLRRAAAYLFPGDQPKMMYPLVRDLAAPTALLRVPVTVTCRVFKFSTQGCYKWLSVPCSQRDDDDAHLIGHRASENVCGGCARCRRSSVLTAGSVA